MPSNRVTLILLVLTLFAAAPGLAAETLAVHDGDRVTGVLGTPGAEVGLTMLLLEGTVLDLRMKADRDLPFEPEIRLYGPDDVRADVGTRYRHAPGSRKVRLRKHPISKTGRYTIVLRAAGAGGGAYRLKIRADHPRKIRGRGTIAGAGLTGSLRFPAFAGTTADVKVKGRKGLLVAADRWMLPGVVEEALPGGEVTGPVVRHRDAACARLGDFRVVIEGRDGTAGEWKGKVRLTHPDEVGRDVVADGQTSGTFTDGLLETRPVPEPPPGPDPEPTTGWRQVDRGFNSASNVTGEKVIRTPSAWTTFWDEHVSNITPKIPAPAVDFDREIVVAILLPRESSGGSAVDVDDVVRGGNDQKVLIREYRSHWTCPVLTAESKPYVIIAVPKLSGAITFDRTVQVSPPCF